MRNFRRIITWAMLSIMMQLAGLLFLDQVVFKHSSDFEATTITTSKKEAVKVTIPENAKDVFTSYTGRYVSYYNNEKLMLINTKTSESKEVVVDEGAEILYSAWLPKDNYLIIAEKIKNDAGSNVIRIVSYNARTAVVKPVINELCKYQTGYKIDEIEASKGPGTKYISVSRGVNSTIYRVDINDELRQLPMKVPSLGAMKVFQHKDELVYEDSINKNFYRYSNKKSSKLNFMNSKNLELLALDENDNIYMGEKDGDKINKIIYGKADVSTDKWNAVTLDKAKKSTDIFVSGKGQIMVNDNLEGKVTNLTTGDTITYEGKFIEITERVICSSNKGTLFIKNLIDVD